MIHRRLGPKSDHVSSTVHSTHLHILRGFPLLHGSGAGYTGIVVLIYSWYWNIEWRWHLLEMLRCWDVSSTSSLHRSLKFVNSRRVLRWTQRWQDSRKPWEHWDSQCRNRAQKTYAPGKDFDDWDFTFNGYAGTLDPACPALLKQARQSPTMVMATPPHEQQSAALLYLLTMLTQKVARKVVAKAGNHGFEAYRRLCLMYGTSDQEGSTGLFVQIMT